VVGWRSERYAGNEVKPARKNTLSSLIFRCPFAAREVASPRTRCSVLGARRPPAPRRHISSAARFAPKKSTPHPRRSVPCPPPRVIASLHRRSSISRSRGRSRTSRRRDGPRRAPARARRPRRGGDRSDAGESRAHDSRRCSLLAAAALTGRGGFVVGFRSCLGASSPRSRLCGC